MKTAAFFTHRLDLGLRLSDAVSGRRVPGRSVRIFSGGGEIFFGEKDGVLTLQNLGPRPLRLHIVSAFYEPLEVSAAPDEPELFPPLLELPLVPGPRHPEFPQLWALEGVLPGISRLSAVRPGDGVCLLRFFDPGTRLMTVFNPHRLDLIRACYALVDSESGSYEPFRILEMRDDGVLRIDRVLERAGSGSRVCPLVSGWCGPGGEYRLLLPPGGQGGAWLIRCLIGGQPCFRTVSPGRTGEIFQEREGSLCRLR